MVVRTLAEDLYPTSRSRSTGRCRSCRTGGHSDLAAEVGVSTATAGRIVKRLADADVLFPGRELFGSLQCSRVRHLAWGL
jgi:hypothetical protein